MFLTQKKLILASSSPRRQQFLHNLDIKFTVITADIEERPFPNELPDIFSLRMAQAKANEVATANPNHWVVGADTVVTLKDGTILGKPCDEDNALDMLKQLNGSTHRVMTGLCLCLKNQEIEEKLVQTTKVTFMDFHEDILKAYINTGEPMDKAGAYAIQGSGSFLVKSINGSCTNVIGLPVNQLISLLLNHRIITPA